MRKRIICLSLSFAIIVLGCLFYYMFLINPETGELFTAEEAFEEANDSCTNEARNSVMYGTQQNFSFNN